jgi:hypothetical protein|tara:strand:+ start:324 stop:443 length:120 start_codon:yes stop_codon:yes gene_type:complete
MFEKIKEKVMKKPIIFGAIAVIVVIAIYVQFFGDSTPAL